MICPHCQKENGEFATVCAHCGKSLYLTGADQSTQNTIPQQPSQPVIYCSTCGNPCHPNAIVCVKCGSPINKVRTNKVEVDEIIPALKWISFFIPIVGLVLYIMKVQSAPNSAKEYGKMALIGFCVSLGFVVLAPLLEEILWHIF